MFSLKEVYDKCWHCENYYGPCFGEPLCMTCHLFLYPALGEDLTSNASSSGVAGNLKRGQNANSARSNLLVSGGGNDRGGDLSACSNVDGISLRSSLSATDNDSTNQIRNIIEKYELNDSGNEDSDSDQLNFDLTSSENDTAATTPTTTNAIATTATALPSQEDSQIDTLASPNNHNVSNEENFDNDNDEDNEDEDEDDDGDGDIDEDDNNNDIESRRRQRRRWRRQQQQQQHSRRRVLSARGNSGCSSSNNANYYPIQYSRKQLDSLARNNARFNRNNNIHKRSKNSGLLSNVACYNMPFGFFKRVDPLKEQLISLSTFNLIYKNVSKTDLINHLPNEVLWNIFKKLDDLSLWSVSRVCKRWCDLVSQEISEEQWKTFISNRWIFFRSVVKITSYQALYSQMVESSNCFYCLQNIHNRPNSSCNDEVKKSWRHKRLLLELKALHQDPMPGINARPLDASCYYWQASITGPVGSPYEGGVFNLFLKIPQSYPLNPPLVQFITKIYHPNISKHGDIGLDSIHENWSLALTISKVLISIQSLLTDPYTKVCMEKDIGRLYMTNRESYERNARFYTWKYAMSDYIQFDEQHSHVNYFGGSGGDEHSKSKCA